MLRREKCWQQERLKLEEILKKPKKIISKKSSLLDKCDLHELKYLICRDENEI